MKSLRFLAHLFFEDIRIPIGLACAMIVMSYLKSIVPPLVDNSIYLTIVLLTLLWGIVAEARR